MSYTPKNSYIYLSAFNGAMSGMGGFTRGPMSGNPNDYSQIVRIAGLFAEEVDTLLNLSSNVLNTSLITSLAAGLYSGRYQDGTTRGDYQAQAAVLSAMVTAGQNYCLSSIGSIPALSQAGFEAKNVVLANVADLNAFTIDDVNNDHVTDEEGDIVLLPAQTNPEENALYSVGHVTGNHAPLTRINEWSGLIMPNASTSIWIRRGQLYAGTYWRSFSTTPFLVGTDDPWLYPQSFVTRIQLDSGVGLSTGLWIMGVPYLDDGPSAWVTRVYSAGGFATTARYDLASFVNGEGIGSIQFNAYKADGTTNDTDTSLLAVEVNNWAIHV